MQIINTNPYLRHTLNILSFIFIVSFTTVISYAYAPRLFKFIDVIGVYNASSFYEQAKNDTGDVVRMNRTCKVYIDNDTYTVMFKSLLDDNCYYTYHDKVYSVSELDNAFIITGEKGDKLYIKHNVDYRTSNQDLMTDNYKPQYEIRFNTKRFQYSLLDIKKVK